MNDKRKIQVLCIDDSALIRSILKEIINSQPDMEVVGVAPDPIIARDLIKQTNPDVLTLDVEMPKMDGLDFLEKLMRLRPMPVVMISSLTERGSEATLRALELGAVDFVAKPKLGMRDGMNEYADQIADKIRVAARARLRPRTAAPAAPVVGHAAAAVGPAVGAHVRADHAAAAPVAAAPARTHFSSTEKLIIVGASTGGTEAIKEFLVEMPPDCPGILIVQHMPAGFTTSFAKRLDGLCRIRVKEAVHGERVLPGHAYIAPGDMHLSLGRSGANYITELDQGPPVNRHRPAVDVLFRSAARNAGANALGVILTGMGKDGAAGMLEMRNAGAYNVAQDEASCVVYGMPKEAVAHGGVHEVLPLSQIGPHVLARLSAHGRVTRV
ncbi:Protein-glutamate methylesterase/protein-glutamine glutaminase [Ralstonia condita]|jgi:two-component system chemotaxis response regulator CheB|uniref:Protein-glutamate methylesterase/protein-glutamine glutaminase n=1 Tax=Ralstonia condita TaxID=3058600 RepID=A0ABN9INR6_9RALS|nr:chemotaxis response regulator protein-glutamate methylesterase [Ralstonia sp. LMG 7141]CAJ0788555.1 Protein-glutamate methylesterase/protein-glutamine glutaminase [Ralstonia sp. LMG 7141]